MKKLLIALLALLALTPSVCLSNSYYNHGSVPAYQGKLDSAQIRTEFNNITTGFTSVESDINTEEDARAAADTALETSVNTVTGVMLSGVYSNDLAAAIIAIGSTPTTLVCDDTVTIASGTTASLNANTIWEPRPGCTVQGIAGGGTETIQPNGGVNADPSLDWIGANVVADFSSSKTPYVWPDWWTQNETPGATDMGLATVSAAGKPVKFLAADYYSSTAPVAADYCQYKGAGKELTEVIFPITVTTGFDLDEVNFCDISDMTINMTTKGANYGVRVQGGYRNNIDNVRVVSAGTGAELYEKATTSATYGNRITRLDVGTCNIGLSLNGADATHLVNGNQIWGIYVINYTEKAISFTNTRGNDVRGVIIGGTSSPTAATRPVYLSYSNGDILDVAYVENDTTAEYVLSVMDDTTASIVNVGQAGAGFSVGDVEFDTGNEQYRNTIFCESVRTISQYADGQQIFNVISGARVQYTGLPDHFTFAHGNAADTAYIRYNNGIGGANQNLITFDPARVIVPAGAALQINDKLQLTTTSAGDKTGEAKARYLTIYDSDGTTILGYVQLYKNP